MKLSLKKPLVVFATALTFAACGDSDTTDLLKNINIEDEEEEEITVDPIMKITGDVTKLGGRGEWGGLVLTGYGKVNNGDTNGQTTSEAVPDGVTRYYGGNSNGDTSGSLKYIVLAETGEAFRPDEEVQGLTMEAVGSGTQVSYVQVTNSDDDGIEWFGGAAKNDHLVISGQADDCLDIDLGFQGTIQFAICITGKTHGDKVIESDNNGDNFGATPKTSPIMANLTLLGDTGNEGKGSVVHREGFGGEVYRSVITDNKLTGGTFGKCLDIDSELDEDMFYGDVVFNCSKGIDPADDAFTTDFMAGANYDGEADAALTINATKLGVTATFTKSNYTSILTGAGLVDTNYVGAVDPAAATAWFEGWTIRDAGIDGNLPGSASFHPLQEEIEDGSLAPAAKNGCLGINAGFATAVSTTVFGKEFPVCIMSGTVTSDTTLTPDHVYLLDGTVNVGNGDVEIAFDESKVKNVTLTIQPGTQILGISETASALVITRGSKIQAEGTAELPIVFGGVTAEDL
jgi:hypothetical protein